MVPRSINLATPIGELKSIGPKNVIRLRRLGIHTLRHLLWHLPARYEDYSQTIPISDLRAGEKVTIQGEVMKIGVKRIFPRRLTIVDAIIKDDSGVARAIWFNQPFIANSLTEGTPVSLAGKVSLDKRGLYLGSPIYEKMTSHAGNLRHTAGLIPVYPETEGITSKYLRFLIQPILEGAYFEDPLPKTVREQYGLVDLNVALHTVHYPSREKDIEAARKRLSFEDLLMFQLKALIERRKVAQLTSTAIPFEAGFIKKVIDSLPFVLTGDQKIAAWEILSDLQKPYPMNRLLEGDVGSGKTVVAFLAAMQTAKHSFQTVIMAPTEVLASQHFQTIRMLSKDHNVDVALLTSSQAILNDQEQTKAKIKHSIEHGAVQIIIGTHAVLQKDIRFRNLGIVVVDEQHRFGIAQRSALLKSEGQTTVPHLLSMTATPIPRTLALTIFGDLDISLLRQKPKDRMRIITQVVNPKQRHETYLFIDEHISAGRQVFVICPRVQLPTESIVPKATLARQNFVQQNLGGLASTSAKKPMQGKLNLLWAEVKAVTEEYEKLSKELFPHRRVAMLHGKMKPKEKQAIMAEFKSGWHDILVATSVVEVGVDISNATIMMIESADRFGLAQLHQFRGRVGRGGHQSYCFLLPTSGETLVNRRLKALVASQDGFELAEQDMKLRGPGEFFGIKQSGMPDLTMAALTDMDLIKKARVQARILLKEDPRLTRYPLLRQRLEEFRSLSHFE